jgi:hypothetical protein
MSFLKNTSISLKISAGYIIVIAMLIIVAGLTVTRLQLTLVGSDLLPPRRFCRGSGSLPFYP